MTSKDFAYWLQGFFEIAEETEITPRQVEIIKKTGCSYGTISRIVKKHQRFDEYYTRYEKDGISLC